MSIVRAVDTKVFCDFCGELRAKCFTMKKDGELRELLAAGPPGEAWRIVDGKDMCPFCVQEKASKCS
jgi:hypothetical protein